MNIPAYYNLLNKKYDNFVEYCNDAGIIQPENFAEFIVRQELLDTTYSGNEILAKARLAWALIKCGIYYKNGFFYYMIGSCTMVADLEEMIYVVLGHLTDKL